MRILHIPHAYWPVWGGAERYCQRLSEELAARGHKVRVVTANVDSPEAFYQLGIPPAGPQREIHHAVEVVRITFGGPLYRLGPSRQGPGRLARALLRRELRHFQRRLAGEIDAFRPDVVMTLPHLFANVRCVLEIHRGRSFPLVLVPLLHEADPYWPFDELAGAFRRADAVIAHTEHEAGRLREAYGVPPDRVFNVGMGVEVPRELPERKREPMVLFLGRKAPSKRIDLLVEAIRLVWQRRPEATLVLAGARVPMTDEFDRLLGDLSAEERAQVRSADDVSEDEKTDLLESASCLVLPSDVESFGIVLLEAWAHGTPVVALDVAVHREVINHGEDGLLVPPEPRALAEAISSLLDDPAASVQMGTRGRKKALTRFDWHHVVDRYEEALLSVVA